MTEQEVIERLDRYLKLKARTEVLSTYSVGAGITVSRLNQDDQLQELHRRLRGLPSYMYLNGYEQKLETTAHAYMTRYPAGVKSQQRSIPTDVQDDEDRALLQELHDKIGKVVVARGYGTRSDIDEILERLSELQDAQYKPMRIQRVNEAELDAAIADLEKRGYKLLQRGTSMYSTSQVNYKPSSLKPYRVRDKAVHSQYWAVLRKEEPS